MNFFCAYVVGASFVADGEIRFSLLLLLCSLCPQKVLQDFVAHILAQISALLPVEYVKQVAADPPQFPFPRPRSTPEVSQETASPNSVSTNLGTEGGLTCSQEEKSRVNDGDDAGDDDGMITKRESVELYVHRALKMTACCTSLVDILSDPLLIHICMQVNISPFLLSFLCFLKRSPLSNKEIALGHCTTISSSSCHSHWDKSACSNSRAYVRYMRPFLLRK